MEIKVLMENVTYSQNLKSQHGLSFLITDENIKILFDTAQNQDFICNAIAMNENLKDVDYVVLSHGHYDHTGGLESFLQINKTAKIIMSRYGVEEKFSNSTGEIRGIGFPLKERYMEFENEFIFIDDYYKISDNIEIYSNIEMKNEFEDTEKRLFVKRENEFVKDRFEDELYLVIKKNKKLNLITGCAHRGIINILEGVSEITGIKEYGAVIGGIHTKGNGDARAKRTAEELLKIGADKYYLNHCTGVEEYAVIKGILKERAEYFFTGRKIEI